jgi:lysophospholipase L1-like esterase
MASWGCRWLWLKQRTLPTLLIVALLAVIALGLRANAINVLGATGKWTYGLIAASLLVLFFLHPFLVFHAFGTDSLYVFDGWSRWYMGATTLLVNTAVLLLALECVARVFPVFDSFEQNPGSHFFWPEWYEPRNSLGYHDHEVGEKVGPRILLLGDSYTEGAGVRRFQRFANQLEKLWKVSAPHIEVYAGARCGYDTIDEARLLEQTGDTVKPDAVMVCYVLNDAERDYDAGDTIHVAVWERFLLSDCHSYLFYWIQALRTRTARASVAAAIQAQHRTDSLGWQHVLHGLDRIAAWCDQRRIPKGLVVFPLFDSGTEQHREVMERVVAAARERGYEAYNLLDIYHAPWRELSISPFDCHPNSRAHMITAIYLSGAFRIPPQR